MRSGKRNSHPKVGRPLAHEAKLKQTFGFWRSSDSIILLRQGKIQSRCC